MMWNLSDIEQCRVRGAEFLPKPSPATAVRIRPARPTTRGHVFPQSVRELRRVHAALRHGDLRRLGYSLRVVPGDKHVNVTADLLRSGDGIERRTLEGDMIVFGDDEGGHGLMSSLRDHFRFVA
jgi:hypothetical protein